VASYHLTAQPVKRSEGRSVVAMAAYRAGERLADNRRGTVADYSGRRGVAHAEIMIPAGAAAWLADRKTLWNYVERMETRRDAQLAREINMALPHELTDAERLALVRRFVGEQFVARGMVADFAIHHPVAEKGDDPRNFHAHVLLTLRQAGASGLRRVKTREWNSDAMLVAWRAAWSECQNEALRAAGQQARVDHRSFAARKAEAVQRKDWVELELLDREPEVHVGPKARKAERGRRPVSRDREVGPVRKGADGKAVRRSLLYTFIDEGSRGDWNVRRLARNARKFAAAIAKTELRLARMRLKLRHYERRAGVATGTAFKRVVGTRAVSAPDGGANLALSGSQAAQRMHARRRHAQVLWLIDQLDRLFFALVGFRESQLARATQWRNRMAGWQREELFAPGGEGRQRFQLP
jgi:hypothetical protein